MNEIATGTEKEASRGYSQAKRETMQSLTEKGVEYCMPFYVDAHGIAKTKTVPVSHFDRMMRGSELFTGAALDGVFAIDSRHADLARRLSSPLGAVGRSVPAG